MADKYVIQRRTASGLENVAELPALESGKIDMSWLPVVGSMGSAIIERGDNANGEYIRWADGTQVCWAQMKTLQLSIGGSTVNGDLKRYDVPITFPSAFITAPSVCVSGGQNQSGYGWSTAATITSTNAMIRVFAYPTTITQLLCSWLAIGRWK